MRTLGNLHGHGDRMSRDKRYQRLLNDKRWWGEGGVKVQVWRRAGAVCEQCKEEGIITGSLQSQLDCHHIIPVETGRTIQEMERLCYDVNNIRLLCVAHHIAAHVELRSHTHKNVQERKQQKRIDFMRRNDPNFTEDKPSDHSPVNDK